MCVMERRGKGRRDCKEREKRRVEKMERGSVVLRDVYFLSG